MNGFKYIKIYSFIDIIFIIFFTLLYIFTLKKFLILLIISFSVILITYIFLYYSALKGKVSFIKPDNGMTKNKIKIIIFEFIFIALLFILFYFVKNIDARILSFIIFIIASSIIIYKYNINNINSYQK